MIKIIAPALGFIPLDEHSVKEATSVMDEKLKIIEATLSKNKFLVGDNLTLADIVLALPILWLFRASYGSGKRNSLCPNVERWV